MLIQSHRHDLRDPKSETLSFIPSYDSEMEGNVAIVTILHHIVHSSRMIKVQYYGVMTDIQIHFSNVVSQLSIHILTPTPN